MRKKVRWINNYYDIADEVQVGIVYREGQDGATLHMEIGPRRIRKIENVEGTLCYLIVIKKHITHYEEYVFYDREDKKFLNLCCILDNIGIQYEQLGSKDFQKTKRIEKDTVLYNKGMLSTDWYGGDLCMYSACAVYIPKEMYIANKEVYESYALSCYRKDSLYQNIVESMEQSVKSSIELNEDFFSALQLCEKVNIEWDGGYLVKDVFPNRMYIYLYFKDSDKSVIIELDEYYKELSTILPILIRCDSYEKIVKTYNKLAVLGMTSRLKIIGIK